MADRKLSEYMGMNPTQVSPRLDALEADKADKAVQDWLALEPVKNKQAARRFFTRLFDIMKTGTESRVGIAYYGDSVSPHVFSGFTALLSRILPIGAETYPATNPADFPSLAIIPASSSGAYVESRTQTIDQSSYDGASGTVDFRYLPSGASISMDDAAVVTLGNSDPGLASECMVHFFGRVGDGVATVEITNQSMSTVIASDTVDLDDAGATKVSFSGLVGSVYRIRITMSGGPGVMTGAVFLRPYGIIPLCMGIGGSTFDQNNYGEQTMFDLLCDDYEVKLFFVQAKDETEDTTDFSDALDRLQGRTDASVIICGNAPDSQTVDPDLQDAEFAAAAQARDMVFLDQRRIFKDYAEISGLGWMQDGTHPNAYAQHYAGMHLLNGLGLQGAWNLLALETLRGDQVQATEIQVFRYDSKGYETVVRDANNGGDPSSFLVQYLREVVFNQADGGVGATLRRYGTYGVFLASGDANPSQFRGDVFNVHDPSSNDISRFGRFRIRQLLRDDAGLVLDDLGLMHVRSYSASALDDAGDAVNTSGDKEAGVLAYDSSGRLAVASGSAASDAWDRVAMQNDTRPIVTTAQLFDANHPINTDGRKKLAFEVFDSTSNEIMVALGSGDTDNWKSMLDGELVTPVV